MNIINKCSNRYYINHETINQEILSNIILIELNVLYWLNRLVNIHIEKTLIINQVNLISFQIIMNTWYNSYLFPAIINNTIYHKSIQRRWLFILLYKWNEFNNGWFISWKYVSVLIIFFQLIIHYIKEDDSYFIE